MAMRKGARRQGQAYVNIFVPWWLLGKTIEASEAKLAAGEIGDA